MKNNLIIWFPLLWIFFLFRNKWKNKCFKFYENNINKCVYREKLKHIRYNLNRNRGQIALLPKFLIYFLFFVIKSKNSSKNMIDDIKNLANRDFFTYESISATNKINVILSKHQIILLKIFYLKITKNENRAFLLFLLLLAGDIESNPGEIFSENATHPNDKFQPFKKCGMHFTHININSILPKID